MNNSVPLLQTSNAPSHIPHIDALRIDDKKVADYLLNDSHKEGGAKSAFFKSVGFAASEIEVFKSAMREHAKANPVAMTDTHAYGRKFVVDCFLEMPNGKSYCIRTVWNDHEDGQPARLITAHPLG